MSFAENLNALPESIGARLRLHDAQGVERGVIENAPGTAGSFKLYAYLAQQHGSITPEAATAGVALFAEHAEDARQHPGKHPNIDRLFACIATQRQLNVSVERD
jgi:hypothetical protein